MNKTIVALRELIAKILMFAGGAWAGLWALAVLMALVDENMRASMGNDYGSIMAAQLIMGAVGVLVFLVARKELQLIKKYKRYVPVLSEDPSGYIPGVAAAVGEPELAVMENVEKMVKKRYFANAHFDRDTKCLVVAKKQQTENTVTVRCAGCGGMNTVRKGTIDECAYCGAPIKG